MFADIFSAYRDFILFGASTALLVILLVRYWARVSLWWMNVVYSFPIIGKISRTRKDFRMDAENRWYQSERSLLSNYSKFIKINDRRGYLECKTYLQKAQDHGRTPIPIFIWALIVLLVFVEAMGFSYVLAGMTVPGASEAVQLQATYGIAFMISVILVAFTHFAGHELHRSGIIRRALSEWQVANARGDAHDLGTNAPSLELSIDDDTKSQNDDDDAPRYAQTVERVGKSPSYWVTVLTAIIVVIVATGATYVRIQVLDKELAEETSMDITGSRDFYGDVPAEIAGAAADADQKAAEDIRNDTKMAGWGTYIVLAFVFVFLQILGILFGMRWGFAGRESKDAFKKSGGKKFDTYHDFKAYTYDRIADIASSKHNQLRTRMQKVALKRAINVKFNNLSFADYMEEKMHEQYRADVLHDTRKLRAQPAASGPNKATEEQGTRRFHYADSQNQATTTSFTLAELESLIDDGTITLSTNVFEVGGSEWRPLGEFVRRADLPPPPPQNLPPPPLAQVKQAPSGD